MSVFAKIENGIVASVIVADQGFINTLDGTYIETSLDGSIRANAAGPGDTYDAERDVFYPPQPYPSWSLNDSYKWCAPTPKPSDTVCHWDEGSLSWIAA